MKNPLLKKANPDADYWDSKLRNSMSKVYLDKYCRGGIVDNSGGFPSKMRDYVQKTVFGSKKAGDETDPSSVYFAIADAVGGKVVPSPYGAQIETTDGILLVNYEGPGSGMGTVYNELTGNESNAFPWDDDKAAVEAALTVFTPTPEKKMHMPRFNKKDKEFLKDMKIKANRLHIPEDPKAHEAAIRRIARTMKTGGDGMVRRLRTAEFIVPIDHKTAEQTLTRFAKQAAKATHVLYDAGPTSYSVRVMRGGDTIDEYNGGNSPYDSVSEFSRTENDVIEYKRLLEFAEQTAKEMAEQYGVPENMIDHDEDLMAEEREMAGMDFTVEDIGELHSMGIKESSFKSKFLNQSARMRDRVPENKPMKYSEDDLNYLLDWFGNMFGELKPDIRKRLMSVINNPNDRTWNNAYSIILNPRKWTTLWQAVIKVDPWFPKTGPSEDRNGKRIEGWAQIPSQKLLVKALLNLAGLNSMPTKPTLSNPFSPEDKKIMEQMGIQAAAKPKCPHCGSAHYSLMPTDFETAKCEDCGKNWEHGIVEGINDPKTASGSHWWPYGRHKFEPQEGIASCKACDYPADHKLHTTPPPSSPEEAMEQVRKKDAGESKRAFFSPEDAAKFRAENGGGNVLLPSDEPEENEEEVDYRRWEPVFDENGKPFARKACLPCEFCPQCHRDAERCRCPNKEELLDGKTVGDHLEEETKIATPHDQEAFGDGPVDFFEPVENPHSIQPLRASDKKPTPEELDAYYKEHIAAHEAHEYRGYADGRTCYICSAPKAYHTPDAKWKQASMKTATIYKVEQQSPNNWSVIGLPSMGWDNEGVDKEYPNSTIVPGLNHSLRTPEGLTQGIYEQLYDEFQTNDNLKAGDIFDTPVGQFICQGVDVLPHDDRAKAALQAVNDQYKCATCGCDQGDHRPSYDGEFTDYMECMRHPDTCKEFVKRKTAAVAPPAMPPAIVEEAPAGVVRPALEFPMQVKAPVTPVGFGQVVKPAMTPQPLETLPLSGQVKPALKEQLPEGKTHMYLDTDKGYKEI